MPNYIKEYEKCVIECIAKTFNISLETANHYLNDSGSKAIIEAYPQVSLHYPVKDWMENIQAYLNRHC